MQHYVTNDIGIELARETMHRFFAAMMRHPSLSLADMRNRKTVKMIKAAAELLREDAEADPVPLGFGELSPDQLNVGEIVARWHGPPDDLFAEYDRVFGLGPTAECPPYETEFAPNQEPFYRAQQMADVAGFYRAFGLVPSRTLPERADHIALELEFMAVLQMKIRLIGDESQPDADDFAGICREAQYDFLKDHLCWWIPSFATGLRRKAVDGPYAAVSRVLSAFLPTERRRFDIKAPNAPVRPRSVERSEGQSECESCTTAAT